MSASRRTVGQPIRANRPRAARGDGGATTGSPLPPIVVTAIGLADGGTFSPGEALVLWGYAALTAPSAVLSASGGVNTFGFRGTLPTPLLSARGGANAALTAPAALLTTSGTFSGSGRAALSAPSALVTSSGTTTATGTATLTFGSRTLGTYDIVGYSGAVLSVTIGAGTVRATGTGGARGRAALTLPLFDLVASGTRRAQGNAALVMPAPQLGATAQAWLVAPGAKLVAVGTATVAATYEAYAVNLNHKQRPGVQPVDEVTRYTNFPFDYIVRYENSYFGVAADGLYLLEGTTDFNAVAPTTIPWSFKTAMTDFQTPLRKTVESVYFGGRMGAATVSIHVGEAAPKTYSYPKPPSSTAQNYRQVMGRGLKARYFAFSVSGSDTMELDDLDFSVGNMTRKI